MSVRALDANGDWNFGKGSQSYFRDLNEIRQNIATRVKMWRGDCFFAPDEGVDYNNYFDPGAIDFLDADIRRVILQTSGVLSMRDFSSQLTNREYTATVSVVTIFGEIEVEL